MANKIYIVDLTDAERTVLLKLIQNGKRSSHKVMRTHILLLADEGKTDQEITGSLHTSPTTVQRTRQRFVEGNLEGAIHERPRPGARRKLSGKGQATLIALRQSQPPPGRKRWTLALLTDRLVALQAVDEISPETVRKELKKRIKLDVKKKWRIPTVRAEFVWRMEDVLEMYARPYTQAVQSSASMKSWSN